MQKQPIISNSIEYNNNIIKSKYNDKLFFVKSFDICNRDIYRQNKFN
jgi:hypothetical protein